MKRAALMTNELVKHRAVTDSPLLAMKLSFGEDRRWLTAMAVLIGIEAVWWVAAWRAGIAPPPFVMTYVVLAFAGLFSALALRMALRSSLALTPWPSTIVGTMLLGVGASFFLPLKYAIPNEVQFWMDTPVATAERTLFTADPWLLLDQLLGWAVVPIDRLYALWLPVQSIVLFSVMLQPASAAKSRLLIAYSLAWFLLGVVAAVVFSSAGPLFYDRVFGGSAFAPLHETLRTRGAWVVLAESDAMWLSLATGRPGMLSGISAVPSIHVAVSLWMLLAARSLMPRAAPFAAVYFAFIWLGSVQLGWHYVVDGVAGAVGMLAIWALAGSIGNATRPSWFEHTKLGLRGRAVTPHSP